jgi:carbamoyltransferase
MKLLALRLCEHDSNISYYNGKELKYIKLERIKKIKHFGYNNLIDWKEDLKNILNIHYKDINQIAIVIDTWKYGLHQHSEDFFPSQKIELPNIGKVERINHHYAHALSTWMFKKANVSIVIDGFGELNKPWSVFKNNKLIDVGCCITNGSIGIEMAKAGKWLGVQADNELDIAGKVMSLQSYGKIDKGYLNYLKDFDINNVNQIFSIDNWFKYKGDILLGKLDPLNWIKTVHYKMGYVLLDFFKKHCNKNDIISYTGGVAQNVIWNTILKNYFKNLIIPPHSPDDGLSLGAIEYLRIKNNLPEFKLNNFPYIQNDESPIEEASIDTIKKTAKFLADGKIIGWYQGNGEIGPRALGNRSILMNPKIKNGKNLINKIKKRENYRPFGASILKKYFKGKLNDSYMLYVQNIKGYDSIRHVDNTCRIHIVENENKLFNILLEEFYKITKCPFLLNTSLNINGKPIVGNIESAVSFFNNSDLDCLIVGNKIYIK